MPNQCGQCGAAAASGTCKKDCNGDWGVPAARAAVDQCGRCRGGRTGAAACARDCRGVWGGPVRTDACGVCGGPGNVTYYADRDGLGW